MGGDLAKTISSRNVHLQLEGTQGLGPPQGASVKAAGALTGILGAPRWGGRLPLRLTHLSCKVLSLSHDI